MKRKHFFIIVPLVLLCTHTPMVYASETIVYSSNDGIAPMTIQDCYLSFSPVSRTQAKVLANASTSYPAEMIRVYIKIESSTDGKKWNYELEDERIGYDITSVSLNKTYNNLTSGRRYRVSAEYYTIQNGIISKLTDTAELVL